MVYTPEKILSLLPLLDEQIADDLENENLDFKECPTEARLRDLAKEMAVCLGNASGGTVVFGVKERVHGCDKAIVELDFAPDLEALNATLYDSIDPKLPVQFEWLMHGGRRLLLMHVHPSMPPYTTTSGKGWMRVGKDCKPLTGSLLRQLREKAGLSDPTAKILPIDNPIKGQASPQCRHQELYRPGPATGLPDHERAGVGRSGLPGRSWTNGSMAHEAIIEQTVNQRSLFASLFAS